MEEQKMDSCSYKIAFNVGFDSSSKDIPERLKKKMNSNRKEITKEDVDLKQRHAEERRKKHEAARMERIRQRQQDCARLCGNVESLLDPKSRCKMSPAEARSKLRLLTHDIRTLGNQLKTHVKLPTTQT